MKKPSPLERSAILGSLNQAKRHLDAAGLALFTLRRYEDAKRCAEAAEDMAAIRDAMEVDR